ncbi:hypothetical protein F5X96DRAFT_692653 [Biscogniauxia mediterranea]|nr:hypothetical protein F5X96DRAFT_692653 [Biscogniauxia mediterranea]
MAILKHATFPAPVIIALVLGLFTTSSSGDGSSSSTVGLSPAASPPDGTSGPVSPSFAGFGIEPSNLFSFMGREAPNALTQNLLANLQSYTGYPAHVRLGGNTADYMVYDESHDAWDWAPNPAASGAGAIKWDSMVVGPRFFEAADRLPTGTPVTWGLNLAYAADDWADRIVAAAAQVLARCTNLRLVSFEIGNEPDLYLQNGFRAGDPSWGGAAYARQWRARAQALWDRVLAPAGVGPVFFEAAATASTIGTDFGIAELSGFGIEEGPPDGSSDFYDHDSGSSSSSSSSASSSSTFLSSWNQHDYYFYIGVSTYALTLARLMQLSTTEDQFAAWAAQVREASATGRPYALREMGIVGPVGLAGVTDVLGTALWTLNFLLYAAGLGVESVQLHMTDNSAASAWQPVALDGMRPPGVRPVYYGVAAFDQIIGPSCAARVAPLALDDPPAAYADHARAYAVYQSDALSSVVVINARPANASAADKPSLAVRVRLPPAAAGQTLHLAYLSGPGADATDGTTWNGLSFEQSGDGTATPVDDGDAGPATVQVGDDGGASFEVRDSQAVVATLGRQVGSGLRAANATACQAAAMKPHGIGATAEPSSVLSDSSGDGSGDHKNGAAGTTTGGAAGAASLLTVSLALVAGALML